MIRYRFWNEGATRFDQVFRTYPRPGSTFVGHDQLLNRITDDREKTQYGISSWLHGVS